MALVTWTISPPNLLFDGHSILPLAFGPQKHRGSNISVPGFVNTKTRAIDSVLQVCAQPATADKKKSLPVQEQGVAVLVSNTTRPINQHGSAVV